MREDLTSGWHDPSIQRILEGGGKRDLPPLNTLPHPILEKAASSFGENPDEDNYVGKIASSKRIRLLEIKSSQWRGGVWIDEDNICWLVIAGLAKGDHEDWDDFYKKVERADQNARALLPTKEDEGVLKEEAATQRIASWNLEVQGQVREVVEEIATGGTSSFKVDHPLAPTLRETDRHIGEVRFEIAPVRESDFRYDEVLVEFDTRSRWKGSDLEWDLIVRVLTSLYPPQQGWDRTGDLFSNMAEPGTFTVRRNRLRVLCAKKLLEESTPGTHAHRVRTQGLVENMVNGAAMEAVCGVVFVQTQDHEGLPECEKCKERVVTLSD